MALLQNIKPKITKITKLKLPEVKNFLRKF